MRRPVTFALLALLVAGCQPDGSDLFADVRVSSPRPSTEARPRNAVDVAYSLAAPARVSATLVGPDGTRWEVHRDAERPRADQYVLSLDGTVPGPTAGERRALPDGRYTVLLQAEGGGLRDEASAPVEVRGADTSPPRIEDLAFFPDRISPNADAEADVTRITYQVTEPSRVTLFAERVQADGRRVRAWTGEERRVEAGEQLAQWDGYLYDRPLADGTYEVGVIARDDGGNVSVARRPLTIEAGGIPDAKIVSARVAPRQITRGTAVCLEYTVRNIGSTVLRTQGPDPDYVYDSFDTFSSIENHAYVERAGFWRVGLDWAGSTDRTGAKYPYRWGLGRDLPPGEEVTQRGCVRVNHERTRMVFFGALIQENVAIRDDGVGLAEVSVSP